VLDQRDYRQHVRLNARDATTAIRTVVASVAHLERTHGTQVSARSQEFKDLYESWAALGGLLKKVGF
jgi:hypothetical protein